MTATATAAQVQTVNVGDFFISSWGYDQTNIDFYKVVGVTASGKSVRVQEWSQATVSEQANITHVVPGDAPRTFTDWSGVDQDAEIWEQRQQAVTRDKPVMTKRLDTRYGVRIAVGHNSARLWEGVPTYTTTSGWGH